MTDKNADKPAPPLPKKKPDGNFETDRYGMVQFHDPEPVEKPRGNVTHRR